MVNENNVETVDNMYTLRCGVTLELQKVNQMALQNLTLQSGILDILASGVELQEFFSDLNQKDQIDMSNKMMGVLKFCLMYGVKTNPTHDTLVELKALGAADTENIARMNWLLSILDDDKEAGVLVAKIRNL